jgi:hypothetical protein
VTGRVVVKGAPFPQELRRKDQVVTTELGARTHGVAHRNGRLDHHQRLRVDVHHIPDHRLDRPRIEVIGLRIVIGRRGDDDHLGALVGVTLVELPKIEGLLMQVFLDLLSSMGIPGD